MKLESKYRIKKQHNFIQEKRNLIKTLKGKMVEVRHSDTDPIEGDSLPGYYAGKIIGLTENGFFFIIKNKDEERTLSLFGLMKVLELREKN